MNAVVEQMAFNGQAPWHGIGVPLDHNASLETWIHKSGMNFQYLESPVGFETLSGTVQPFPDHKVLYRSDTGRPLSVVSKRYHVVQPREIIGFYEDLVQRFEFRLETAGVLQHGKKVWALAHTGHRSVLQKSDRIHGYLLLATACDGSLATTAQFTSVRVVCHNTLHVALNGSGHAVKVPHRSVFDANAVKQELGVTVSAWDAFIYRMKALAARPLNTTESERLMETIFTDGNGVKNERAIEQVRLLYHGKGKGSHLPSAQNTAWGVVNAVTEFVDHHRRARSADNRLNSAWFGSGSALKDRARDEALRLV